MNKDIVLGEQHFAFIAKILGKKQCQVVKPWKINTVFAILDKLYIESCYKIAGALCKY